MKKTLRVIGAMLAPLLFAAALFALPAAAEAAAESTKITPPHY